MEQETQFKVRLLCAEKSFGEFEASQLNIPAVKGYLGILAHHTPMVSELTAGKLEIVTSSQNVERYFISGGYVSVEQGQTTVLGEVIETSEQIDFNEAKEVRDSSKKALTNQNNLPPEEITRLLGELKVAEERIYISQLNK